MSQIERIQHAFMDNFLTGKNDIFEHLNGKNEVFKRDRMLIYTRGGKINLIDIMEQDFSVLKALMGDERFYQVVNDYIDAFPSKSFSLYNLSEHWVEFLKTHKLSRSHQAWWEMAIFERYLDVLLRTKDATPVDVHELSQVSQEKWPYLTFELHPSLTHHKFHYNVVSFWMKYCEKPSQPKVLDEDEHWLLWRYQGEVHFKHYESTQIDMVAWMKEGASFGEICADLAETMNEEDVPNYALNTLVDFVREGFVTSIQFDPCSDQ